jgi:hypothetical protein
MVMVSLLLICTDWCLCAFLGRAEVETQQALDAGSRNEMRPATRRNLTPTES